jgi:hypothetical protein
MIGRDKMKKEWLNGLESYIVVTDGKWIWLEE